MKVASLFAGIGGFDLGLQRAGMSIELVCEIDPACQDVLRRHFPEARLVDDVREVHIEPGSVDLICGGFPCQDVSRAGARRGLDGERSGLWFDFLRVCVDSRPRWVVVENVPGLLSSHGGRDFARVLQGLVELGYSVCWRILDSQYFGVPQRRRRLYLVAHLGAGCAEQVLFEPHGLRRNAAAVRPAGRRTAVSFATDSGGHCAGLMMAVRPPCYWDGGQTADTLDVSGLVKRQTMPERRRFQAVIVQDAEGRQRLRRLTPLECERLQGFPDGWTEGHADATRYRMLGNAVTVPVAEWIGRRIIAAHGHGREDCNGENHI